MRLLGRVITSLVVIGMAAGLLVGALLWHEGFRAYAIQTGSMYPTHATGALVIDAPASGRSIGVGDVITFRTNDGLVTHRVNSLSDRGYETKGDANRTADVGIVPRQAVVGVVTWGAAYLGYVFVFFQQPTGILSLMLLCFSIWCAWSAFFPAKEATGKHGPTSPRGERAGPSDEGIVVQLPAELAGAVAGDAAIRLPAQRSAADLFST